MPADTALERDNSLTYTSILYQSRHSGSFEDRTGTRLFVEVIFHTLIIFLGYFWGVGSPALGASHDEKGGGGDGGETCFTVDKE